MKDKSNVPTGGKQREGQFLWNVIIRKYDPLRRKNAINDDAQVGIWLWNISDEEFDKIMKKWKEL